MLPEIIKVARKAGGVILTEYHKEVPSDINWKADDSPLTLADQKAHNCIAKELQLIYPEIPILSEEGLEIPFEERRIWNRFWCVDPMDGTKEFLKKTGQFTVNIALVEDNEPVLGVIYAPVLQIIYYSQKGCGAFKWSISHGGCPYEQIDSDGLDESKRIQVRKPDTNNFENLSVVASRDHAGPAVQSLIDFLFGCETKSIGSSLKFCLVAEGKADAYFRDVPTFEWDTAAAQIIVEEAGGQIWSMNGDHHSNGQKSTGSLTYNKENLHNPELITFGSNPDFWLNSIAKAQRATGSDKTKSK